MDRIQKQEMVGSLHEIFGSAGSVVVSHFNGLTASEATDLRRRMHAVGARFRVIKNSLARRAIEGTPYECLSDLFTGPIAFAFSEDPVAAAKASVDFAKENDHLVVLGGGLGAKRLSQEEVNSLASLPSLDELRAMLVGLLQRPATNVVSVLLAPSGQLARVFSAYGGGAEES